MISRLILGSVIVGLVLLVGPAASLFAPDDPRIWQTHPRNLLPEAEHLLPLMVALGAGGNGPAVRDYADHILGWAVSGYRFG